MLGNGEADLGGGMEGLRDVGGGIGGFFPIGGGFGFAWKSGVEALEDGNGRRAPLSADTAGFGGGIGGAEPGGLGAPGGFGADIAGGFGACGLRECSGSERYGESPSAPVRTPPDFRSLGMPPAKRPPNCGAAVMPLSPALPPATSLLLLTLFAAATPGTGGARPPGALAIPGTGGAPMTGAAAALFALLTIGADRSLT